MRRRPLVGAPYVSGSDTSREAAESIAPQLNALQQRVLEAIVAEGPRGSTADAAEVVTGLSHQTCSARVRELVVKGLIVDSGERRPTRSGRKARVYTVVEHPTEEPVQQGVLRRGKRR